jgi:hypothetical protein
MTPSAPTKLTQQITSSLAAAATHLTAVISTPTAQRQTTEAIESKLLANRAKNILRRSKLPAAAPLGYDGV